MDANHEHVGAYPTAELDVFSVMELMEDLDSKFSSGVVKLKPDLLDSILSHPQIIAKIPPNYINPFRARRVGPLIKRTIFFPWLPYLYLLLIIS
jgi:hypothetical protein